MHTLFDNTVNSSYEIDCVNNIAVKKHKCENATCMPLTNIINPNAHAEQNLPQLVDYDTCNIDPNKNNNAGQFKKRDVYDTSPYYVQKMRAYRNYLNSVNDATKCKNGKSKKMRNRIYINNVYKQGYYELIRQTATHKIYRFNRLINGTYICVGNVSVPNSITLQQYISNSYTKLTRKTINRYDGDQVYINNYENTTGIWNLCSVTNQSRFQPF